MTKEELLKVYRGVPDERVSRLLAELQERIKNPPSIDDIDFDDDSNFDWDMTGYPVRTEISDEELEEFENA